MPDAPLNESWEKTGVWWLPSHPDDQVPGSLTYSRDMGLNLSLIGSFAGGDGAHPLVRAAAATATRPTVTVPVIHGVTSRTLFTLLDALRTSHSFSSPGFVSETYYCHFGLAGGHLTVDELRFDEVHLSLNRLPNWATRSGISTRFEFDQNETISAFGIDYSPPDPYSADVGPSTYRIRFPPSFNVPPEGEHAASITEDVRWSVTLSEPADRDEILRSIVNPLGNLLSLATDDPNQVDGLYLHSASAAADERPSETLTVYFQPAYTAQNPNKRLRHDDMLFTLHDVETLGFQVLMDRWLSVSTDLQHTCTLFFGTRYLQDLPGELRFLNVVRAAEIYHRSRFDSAASPQAEHEARLERVLGREGLSTEDRAWLTDKLRWSNEVSLKSRLGELIDFVGAALPVRLTERLPKRVADTRNYLTHYDPGLESRAVRDGARLLVLSESIVVLLQACFLRELGFDEQAATELVQRNRTFRWLDQSA